MSKPKCYFASHLGFSEVTRAWYDQLLKEASEFVIVVNPFEYAGKHHIAGILAEQDPVAKKLKWNDMAKDLFAQIEQSDMMVAIIDGEPPDTGMANETGFAYALNYLGHKKLPIIGYRNDLRSGGDGELGFNAMFLPPIMETGGIEVRGTRADLIAAIQDVSSKL